MYTYAQTYTCVHTQIPCCSFVQGCCTPCICDGSWIHYNIVWNMGNVNAAADNKITFRFLDSAVPWTEVLRVRVACLQDRAREGETDVECLECNDERDVALLFLMAKLFFETLERRGEILAECDVVLSAMLSRSDAEELS